MQNKKIEIIVNELVTYTEFNEYKDSDQTRIKEENIYKQTLETTAEELKTITKEISKVLNK